MKWHPVRRLSVRAYRSNCLSSEMPWSLSSLRECVLNVLRCPFKTLWIQNWWFLSFHCRIKTKTTASKLKRSSKSYLKLMRYAGSCTGLNVELWSCIHKNCHGYWLSKRDPSWSEFTPENFHGTLCNLISGPLVCYNLAGSVQWISHSDYRIKWPLRMRGNRAIIMHQLCIARYGGTLGLHETWRNMLRRFKHSLLHIHIPT